MFLREIENENFDATVYLNSNFFAKVWLRLEARAPDDRVSAQTEQRQNFINGHFIPYLQLSRYNLPEMPYAQQSSLCKGNIMLTSYLNNIRNDFGNHLHRAVDLLLNVETRIAEMRIQATERQIEIGVPTDEEELSARIRQHLQ